ncbi:unnamed protein product [Prorocentrum cordatum]|uniref:Rad51-like C-terminal domain-containing protein n=1 Tax=Prorocentrum cordatum TaxID=2364126 RepID=A0ABN9YBG3_9DINO|nr:unnamed protein product [Polarella glacialis]
MTAGSLDAEKTKEACAEVLKIGKDARARTRAGDSTRKGCPAASQEAAELGAPAADRQLALAPAVTGARRDRLEPIESASSELLASGRGAAGPGPAAAQCALDGDVALRGMHVCRAYDAEELHSTVRELGPFLGARPGVRALVVDPHSIAFCFRGDLVPNLPQRARVLDFAALLKRYSTEYGLVVVVTNHMTTRFHRGSDSGWLAPALGETWGHQPNTQLQLERVCQSAMASSPLGVATITKSAELAAGRRCHYCISAAGIRDAEPQAADQEAAVAKWAQLGAAQLPPLGRPAAAALAAF